MSDIQQNVKQEVVEKIEAQVQETTNATQEQLDTVKEKLNSIVNKTEENN